MSEFRLVHSGFDKFDAALQGAMNGDLFPFLNAAKEAAQRQNEPYATTLGPELVPVQVHDRGMSGGYAWRLHTGPLGANFFVKEHVGLTEWNFFVASLSQGLLGYGHRDYWARNVQALKDMGATVGLESINRVDFAMDFATTEFALNPDLFVAPPRTKRPAQYGSWTGDDETLPQVLTAGRKVESVTIGRMPGRQVIVYNKRAEAISKRNYHWFEVWGVDPKDTDTQVWRVELRAGKRHLKQDFGISTFQDVEDSIADVFNKMIRDIRYLGVGQTDSNITRATIHTLWGAVENAVKTTLKSHESGLLPGRILEIERDKQRNRYIDNIAGNAAGLAVVEGRSVEDALENLPTAICHTLQNRFEESPQKLAEKMGKVENRYCFLDVKPFSPVH